MPAANMVGPGGATAPSSAQASKRGRNDEPAEESGDVLFTALHRSRMFAWNPSPVVALAACPGSPMLAVGYESGDLELWDLAIMACIQVKLLQQCNGCMHRRCSIHKQGAGVGEPCPSRNGLRCKAYTQ